MGVDLCAETIAFFGTAAAGLISGILYDFFHTIGILSKKKSIISLFDIIFVILSCAVIVSAFYIFNSFQLRWYMFLGLFLGIILYFTLLSKHIKQILMGIFQIIYKIFNFIFKILLTPAHFLYTILLVRFFVPVGIFLKGKIKSIRHKIKIRVNINGSNSNERKIREKNSAGKKPVRKKASCKKI